MTAFFSFTYFLLYSLFLLSAQAMKLHGAGDQDQVSVRSFPLVAKVTEATSLAYSSKGVQQPVPHKYSVLRDTNFLNLVPTAGCDQGLVPGSAVIMSKGSVSVVQEGRSPADLLQ